MMLAVMYGMIPSAKTDSWSSAPPPLNRFTRPSSELFSASAMHVCTLGGYDTPGVGRNEPMRNTTMMPIVKSSLRRRSGVLNALTNALSTWSSWAACAASRTTGPFRP